MNEERNISFKKHKPAIMIVALFTTLQIIILYLFGHTPYPDSIGYIGIAEECVEQKAFYPTSSQIKEHSFIWNVGSINAVVLSLSLFGSVFPLLIAYSIMKGATAWLLYQSALKLMQPKAAFLSLILYVLYPANYGESTSTLSELPFIFFCFSGIYSVLQHKSLIGGFLIGLGNWFRPMGLVFLMSSFILLCMEKAKNKKKNIIRLMGGFIFSISLIGSISYMNSGYFIFQAKTGWMALMQYSWDHDRNTTPDKKLFEKGNPMYHPENFDCLQKDSLWRSNFFKWLICNKGEYIIQMPEKLVRTYISDNVNFCTFIPDKEDKEYMYEEISMKNLIHDFPKYSAIQLLTLANLFYYYLLMTVFVLSCIAMLIKHRFPRHLILSVSIVAIGTAILLGAGHGESRFHIPFMPFIIMTVSAYIYHTYKKNEKETCICHQQRP